MIKLYNILALLAILLLNIGIQSDLKTPIYISVVLILSSIVLFVKDIKHNKVK